MPLAMKLARASAGRPIRALIRVIHLSRGTRGCVTPSKDMTRKSLLMRQSAGPFEIREEPEEEEEFIRIHRIP